MRSLPCPNCGNPVAFSWADFLFVGYGGPRIFCLGCRRSCTTAGRGALLAFGAGLLTFLVPCSVVVMGVLRGNKALELAVLFLGLIAAAIVGALVHERKARLVA